MRLSHSLIAILIALPLGAMAEEQHHHGDGNSDNGGRHGGGSMGMMLERLDQIASILESKDGDKDAADKLAKWEESLKDKPEFQKIDTNGDGHISRDEARAAYEHFVAMIKEKQPDLFAKIDANGDGKLTRDELHAALERYRQDHPPGEHKHGGDDSGGDDNPKPKGNDPDAGQHRPGSDK
jgi:hypothetical protein